MPLDPTEPTDIPWRRRTLLLLLRRCSGVEGGDVRRIHRGDVARGDRVESFVHASFLDPLGRFHVVVQTVQVLAERQLVSDLRPEVPQEMVQDHSLMDLIGDFQSVRPVGGTGRDGPLLVQECLGEDAAVEVVGH